VITVKGISQYNQAFNTAITIGTFDGVHFGHQKIIERLIKKATKLNLKSTILTFFPHPRMVLQQESDVQLLNTIDEKTKILQKSGLDVLIIHSFTKEFSRLSATEFVRDMLVNKLQAKQIIIGYDHRFGRNRDANISDLISFGNTFDFEVEEISAQEIEDVSVSSTKIRHALEKGAIKIANKYLGYFYMLTGVVTKGKGLGRTINFPTANIKIKETYKLIPMNGVYLVQSYINDSLVYGMMNIGYNPTFNGSVKSIEVHFFEFNQDLYDLTLQIDVIDRLRDEKKFDSLEALKEQLKKDKKNSLDLIATL